ncbi:hypothetical protein UFOVP1509_15 [uncultured Caudovirales phage]|uniref:Bacteriophage lambda, Stf, side tail fibre-repeat-2 n=1 Tax=uncultured Caudovirales phage TaxID=2100421 RepID=A0A6J7X7M0_9CAUD|nr:hypothetical protein UFOVP886_11 [uncultured Caudovirales phage]CAB4181247.1 hypothetical protein UFOVP1061_20 [uncultured Caudovirales phage]CAB4204558.1 hypothetical protein UFOVP1402_10 [uncultured Caudovirales phage]CAB5225866.1 hypothetical protein UFOVP1509_15 [uncultured Caudovirales phage]
MATTTNYGWTTPDDTALVKDGASAIRTLGSSVDTTVKALSPGTTAGDVDYYTSSTAKARLAIGTTGQVLTVAGGVPSWATSSSGGMTLLSTTTLTGASTTVSSISGSYNKLYGVIRNYLPATDNTSLRFRFNGDGAATRTSSFSYLGADGSSATTFSNACTLANNIDNATSQGLIVFELPDYTNTATWKTIYWWALTNDATTSTAFRYYAGVGAYNQTGAITSLMLISDSGNITSGTLYLYGVK